MHTADSETDLNITSLVITGVVGIILILLALFASYRYSQSKSSGIVLTGGVTYLGPPSPTSPSQPTTNNSQHTTLVAPTPVKFSAASDTPWKTHAGALYSYAFLYPETLPLIVFQDDPMDSVAFSWNNLPPQQNILINIELIQKRDPKLVTKKKIDYVQDWWRFFSGLKGVTNVTIFTNASGLRGYKAQYINTADETPNVDVFFEVPGKPEIMIHLANGLLDPVLFDRIVDSVEWNNK